MTPLDTVHPQIDTPEGDTNRQSGCSAHYFEIEGPMLGAGWYGQGLRLLDISNARDVRQVGYYRVTGTSTDNPSSNSWDMAFFDADKPNGDGARFVFLFDMSRGVEVLRLDEGTSLSSQMASVTAPTKGPDRFAAEPVGGLSTSTAADGSVSYVCPLFQ